MSSGPVIIITEPVTLRQELPPWNPGKNDLQQFSGIIEVDIDEHGDVVAARIIERRVSVVQPAPAGGGAAVETSQRGAAAWP